MPRRKKKASEMTTEELARRVFPKQVVEELKKVAHQGEETDSKEQEKPSSKAE